MNNTNDAKQTYYIFIVNKNKINILRTDNTTEPSGYLFTKLNIYQFFINPNWALLYSSQYSYYKNNCNILLPLKTYMLWVYLYT